MTFNFSMGWSSCVSNRRSQPPSSGRPRLTKRMLKSRLAKQEGDIKSFNSVEKLEERKKGLRYVGVNVWTPHRTRDKTITQGQTDSRNTIYSYGQTLSEDQKTFYDVQDYFIGTPE